MCDAPFGGGQGSVLRNAQIDGNVLAIRLCYLSSIGKLSYCFDSAAHRIDQIEKHVAIHRFPEEAHRTVL
jgi:hypothetical protein